MNASTSRFLAPAILALAASPVARAIDINVSYFAGGENAVDCCAGNWECCEGGGADRVAELILHMQVAASIWEDIIEDPGVLNIDFWFCSEGSPAGNATNVNGAGHPTVGYVKIPAHLPYFYDPNPAGHQEFDMAPKLYRNVLPIEQNEAYAGAPPEILEVGFNGPGPAVDLLTICLHEIGHVLGLDSTIINHGAGRPPCDDPGQPYYWPDPTLAGGNYGIKAYESPDGDIDCQHLAAGGITACEGEPQEAECKAHQALMWTGALPSRRALPGIVDILAIATAADYQDVDLPRKYALGSGEWHDPDTWLGDRVPDAQDDAYIVNQSPGATVEVYGNDTVRNIFITDGNNLAIYFSDLSVIDDLVLEGAGTFVNVDSSATISAPSGVIGAGCRLHVGFDDSLADFFTVDNFGEISGNGTVDATSLDNRGLIRASGGTLDFTSNGQLDLDGTFDTSASELRATLGDLVFDGTIADPVRSDIRVGDGRTISFLDGWTQQYNPSNELALLGGGGAAAISGNSTIFGRVRVDGEGQFLSPVAYHASASVVLEPGALLQHLDRADYHGGSFTGDGRMAERGGAVFHADTTIGPIEVYDMDGTGSTNALVLPGARVVLDVERIDVALNDGYDATLSVDGELIVNTTSDWALDQTILMNLTGGTQGTIGGAPLRNRGTISVLRNGYLDAPVHTEAGAAMHTIDAASTIHLRAAGSTIEGGNVTGGGTVRVDAGATLTGFGGVAPATTVAGTVRAVSDWLVLDTLNLTTGTVGTVDDTGVLWVTNAWNTGNGVVNVRDGWIAGGNVSNSSSTTGNGFFSMAQFTNRARVAPGSAATGDGSDGTGILAFTGDFLHERSALFDFGVGGLELGEADGLIVDGHLDLFGRLSLHLDNGYVPQLGDVIPIMTWGTRNASFSAVDGLSLPGGLAFELEWLPNVLRLVVVAGCAGDADGDGMVDFGDIIQILADWGPCPPPCSSDLDGNGAVDFGDILIVLGGWGLCP